MNPVILVDSRFLDGIPVATDEAPGYSVLNITDLKTYTFWKGATPGVKYISVDCGVSKAADSLGIVRHNLSSTGSQLSVESSDDGLLWTERLAAFTPSSGKAFLKTFTVASARHWKMRIAAPGSVAPQLAVALLGVRMTFPHRPEAPFVPAKEEVETVSQRSKAGHLLGYFVKFKPFTVQANFKLLERSWVESVFLPFWEEYASDLHPFLWAWDLSAYPEDVRFVRVVSGYSYAPAVSILSHYDSLSLEMEGVKE